jgi:hypothetical protein
MLVMVKLKGPLPPPHLMHVNKLALPVAETSRILLTSVNHEILKGGTA